MGIETLYDVKQIILFQTDKIISKTMLTTYTKAKLETDLNQSCQFSLGKTIIGRENKYLIQVSDKINVSLIMHFHSIQ